MTDREAAQKIIRLLYASIFSIEAVEYAAGTKREVVRNWLSRGNVFLQHSVSSGQGSRTFFAFYDILQIMVTAELSRLRVAPNDTRNLILGIMITLVGNIEELADPTEKPVVERYILLHHSDFLDCLSLYRSNEPNPVLPRSIKDVSRIVIDCKALAIKACEIIRSMPKEY